MQLKRIRDVGGRRGVQVAGTTTSDANGQFSFTELTAGTFEVEVLIDEELFTTPVELSAGAMVVSGITVSQPAAEPAAERSWVGRHPVATGVLIGVGVFFAIAFAFAPWAG